MSGNEQIENGDEWLDASVVALKRKAYNEALEEAAKLCESDENYDRAAIAMADEIRKLKK